MATVGGVQLTVTAEWAVNASIREDRIIHLTRASLGLGYDDVIADLGAACEGGVTARGEREFWGHVGKRDWRVHVEK
jgi:hypothetical protein